MSTEPVVILKELKVVCFDRDLEVVILKVAQPGKAQNGARPTGAWAGDLETEDCGTTIGTAEAVR
jgi:hypothetical protein